MEPLPRSGAMPRGLDRPEGASGNDSARRPEGIVYVCGAHQQWYLSLRGLDPPAEGGEYHLWFMTEDGSAIHICERYADSAATMEHLGNFGANFAERFLGCFTPTAIYVYGDPSDEVPGVLDGFGATYMGSLGGFAP